MPTKKAAPSSIKIERTRLMREADLCAALASKSDTIPITRCVLMIGDGEGLRLAATDTTHTITVKCGDVVVDEPFTAVIDAALLSRVARALPGDEVAITVADRVVTLSAGLSVVELPMVYDADMFPTIPSDPEELWTMPLALVQRLFKSVEFAMSDFTAREQFCGVYVTTTKKTIEFAATDGHVIGMVTASSPHGKERVLFIPARAVQVAAKLDGESVTVGLTKDDAHIAFTVGDSVLYTLGNHFSPPNFQAVLPKKRPDVVLIRREELASAIRRALVVTEGSKVTSRAVSLSLSPSRGRITVAPIDPKLGKSTDQIAADFATWSLADQRIGLNSEYVLGALDAIECDSVRLEVNDNGGIRTPVVVPVDQPEPFEQLYMIAVVTL